jgi:IK cytokine
MDYVCLLSKLIVYVSTFWFQNGYDAMQAQALAAGYQGEWQDYQYAEQLAYPDQYLQPNMQTYEVEADLNILQDPRFMTQEEKDRGLGSVFKRDDQRLQQLREKDAREKDPNFISESYSECYPGYQEYNREIVDSDDEDDLSKMDMGGRVSDLSSFLVLHMNIGYIIDI